MSVFMITAVILTVLHFISKNSYDENSILSLILVYLFYIGLGIIGGAVYGFGCTATGGLIGMLMSWILFGVFFNDFQGKDAY